MKELAAEFRLSSTEPDRGKSNSASHYDQTVSTTLRLGKSVGNRINGRWIDSQSAMASFHLNAFRLSRGLLYTASPRANPVRTAINRRCRNCWRNRHRNIVDIVHRLAAGEFIDSPSISGFGSAPNGLPSEITDRTWSGAILASSRA